MEPYILDYYNEFPIGVNIIQNLNNEYNELEIKYNNLFSELKKYKKPKIIYSSINEYELLKSKSLQELKNFLIDLFEEEENINYIYKYFECPKIINDKLVNILKYILKFDKNYYLNFWICNLADNIISNINIFLQSMTLYPCVIISNINKLINIIYKNIKLQLDYNLKNVAIIKYNKN